MSRLHILILRGRKLPPLLYTFIFTYDLLRIFYLVLIEKLWKSKFVNHVNRLWQLTWFNLRYICSLKGCICLCTETCQKYSVTVIFYYIFHVKPHLFKNIVRFWWNFYQQNVRSENVCNFLWLFLNIFWKHRF